MYNYLLHIFMKMANMAHTEFLNYPQTRCFTLFLRLHLLVKLKESTFTPFILSYSTSTQLANLEGSTLILFPVSYHFSQYYYLISFENSCIEI